MRILACWWLLMTSSIILSTTDDIQSCSRYVFMVKAEQKDENGLQCWDHVSVSSCGGRCDSREVADWVFPFKESHHPVCVYATWRPLVVRLRHCDEGVAAGTEIFRYVSADECHCKMCSSEYTNCEWLPPQSNLLKSLVAAESDEKDDMK